MPTAARIQRTTGGAEAYHTTSRAWERLSVSKLERMIERKNAAPLKTPNRAWPKSDTCLTKSQVEDTGIGNTPCQRSGTLQYHTSPCKHGVVTTPPVGDRSESSCQRLECPASASRRARFPGCSRLAGKLGTRSAGSWSAGIFGRKTPG